MNKIVNVVNFIRGSDPWGRDLFATPRVEMELSKKWKMPTTWLLQYDALIRDDFMDFVNEAPEGDEFGIWFEVVQPMVEKAGYEWKGRYPWDYYANFSFTIGYTQKQREEFADILVKTFEERFGYRPKVMGSWQFDAHTLIYLHEKWGIEGACNCRDQWGTDGYTFWGGYWANAYYPSRVNSFMPAQNPENQINVPVFRMLGSDPLYQYDIGSNAEAQKVITLEPAYPEGGGSSEWIEWFLRENYSRPCLSMAYAQTGQENSFEYDIVRSSLEKQFLQLEKLRNEGKIRIETFGESVKWFKENYRETPASSVVTLTDFRNSHRAGVWYLSKDQRVNLFVDSSKHLKIRDWRLFDEKYVEPFLTETLKTQDSWYDTLPFVDGFLWHPCAFNIGEGTGHIAAVDEIDKDSLRVDWEFDDGGYAILFFRSDSLEVRFTCSPENRKMTLNINWDSPKADKTKAVLQGNAIEYTHRDVAHYRLVLEKGTLTQPASGSFLAEADGDTLLFKPERM